MMSTRGGASGFAPLGARIDSLATVRMIAELRHPHIVVMRPAEDAGFEFDLEGGRSLSELLASRGGSLPLRVALRILLDTLSGLSALHRAQLAGRSLDFVHGEVMPANIIVGRDGVARLVPLVKAHWSPGSPAPSAANGYTAPEKLLGDAFDQRADVFSAGVLLWEAMAGKSLFRDLPVDDVVTHLVGGKVQPPAAAIDAPWSDELSDVAMRALAVDPSDRWEHVGIMGADIETIALGQIAKASELIALVTGREVSRDSMSDEITMPLTSVPSLSPFANSIPATEDSVTVRASRRTPPRADSTLPIETSALPVEPDVITERRRFAIVAAALALSALLLAVAAYNKLTRKSESAITTTVLAPAAAAQPVAPFAGGGPVEAPAESEAPEVAAPHAARPTLPQAKSSESGTTGSPGAQPHAAQDPKAVRGTPKTAAQTGKPKPNETKPDGKPKEDPFGLLKPVKTKPKDDPFGL